MRTASYISKSFQGSKKFHANRRRYDGLMQRFFRIIEREETNNKIDQKFFKNLLTNLKKETNI